MAQSTDNYTIVEEVMSSFSLFERNLLGAHIRFSNYYGMKDYSRTHSAIEVNRYLRETLGYAPARDFFEARSLLEEWNFVESAGGRSYKLADPEDWASAFDSALPAKNSVCIRTSGTPLSASDMRRLVLQCLSDTTLKLVSTTTLRRRVRNALDLRIGWNCHRESTMNMYIKHALQQLAKYGKIELFYDGDICLTYKGWDEIQKKTLTQVVSPQAAQGSTGELPVGYDFDDLLAQVLDALPEVGEQVFATDPRLHSTATSGKPVFARQVWMGNHAFDGTARRVDFALAATTDKPDITVIEAKSSKHDNPDWIYPVIMKDCVHTMKNPSPVIIVTSDTGYSQTVLDEVNRTFRNTDMFPHFRGAYTQSEFTRLLFTKGLKHFA